MVQQTLAFLNEQYPRKDNVGEWKLNFSQYHFYNNRELVNMMNKLINISMEDDPAKDALTDLTLKSLLVRVIQTQHLAAVRDGQLADKRLTVVIDYIREHLSEKIGVRELCQKACMSKSGFFRAFRDSLGLSPMAFITRERINLARRLLTTSTLTVSDVSEQAGFTNPHYFSRIFKMLEGITPKLYRQQIALQREQRV